MFRVGKMASLRSYLLLLFALYSLLFNWVHSPKGAIWSSAIACGPSLVNPSKRAISLPRGREIARFEDSNQCRSPTVESLLLLANAPVESESGERFTLHSHSPLTTITLFFNVAIRAVRAQCAAAHRVRSTARVDEKAGQRFHRSGDRRPAPRQPWRFRGLLRPPSAQF